MFWNVIYSCNEGDVIKPHGKEKQDKTAILGLLY